MGKKKNAKSVIITIIITLIVLAGLSYAGVKYLLPVYVQGQNGSGDTMTDIYKFAVKLFPLLVGLVLIIIASMIASGRDDEEDEDDKLPPNSYDNQLFEVPSDDPSSVKASSTLKKEPEFTPEEEELFVSIFDAPAAEAPVQKTVEEEPAPIEEVPVSEEASPVVDEKKDDALISAIYALVKKLDDMTEYSEDDFEEEDLEDEEDEFEELDSVEMPAEKSSELSSLENKVDKLCDAVTNLATIITNNTIAAVSAIPAQAPVEEETEEVPEEESETEEVEDEPVVEESVEEDSVEEPVADEPADEPVAEPVEETPAEEPTPVEEKASEPEEEIEIEEPEASNEVERFAKIEFESAQEAGYDLSFVITDASLDDVALNLSGLGDAFEVNGKTLIVIPFLSNDEIKDELEKLGAPYELKTIAGGEKVDFEEVIGSQIR